MNQEQNLRQQLEALKSGVTEEATTNKERELRQLADFGNIERLRSMLEEGEADVNGRDSQGSTALHYAMNWYPHDPDKDSLGVVKLLAEHGADVNAAANNGQTPLFDAVMEGRYDVVVYLHERGADVNALLDSGANVLFAIAEELEGRPFNFRVTFQRDGKTVILTDPDAIRAEIGSHPDDETLAYLRITQYLIEQGIDVNAPLYESRQTPLFSSGNRGIFEMVALLLATEKMDVNHQDNYELTVLHYASRHGHARVVQQLLAAGANPNIQEKYGFAPLHEAAENNRLEIAKLLVAAGADATLGLVQDYDKYQAGDTPLKVANRARRRKVANYLRNEN